MRSDKDTSKIACVILPLDYSSIKELHEIIDGVMLKKLIHSINCKLEEGEGVIEELLKLGYNEFKEIKIYDKVTINSEYCAIVVGEKIDNMKDSNNISLLNEVWEVMFLKLKRHMENDKFFLALNEDEEMSNWMINVINSRKKGKLLKDQIRKLDSINFIWSISDLRWEQNLASLVKFLEVNNRWPSYYDDNKIYSWVNTQRSNGRKNKLSKYRTEKLEGVIGKCFWRNFGKLFY